MTIHLTLPEPPSTNRYWRRAGTILHLSAEAKAYKAQVAALARQQGIGPAFPFPQGVPVAVTLEWHRGRRSGDLDNRLKVALDALRRVVYADDDQVVRLVASRHDAPKAGKLVVTVEAA